MGRRKELNPLRRIPSSGIVRNALAVAQERVALLTALLEVSEKIEASKNLDRLLLDTGDQTTGKDPGKTR